MNARRARRTTIACGAAVAGASLAAACVLAEPPAELPIVLKHRPLIIQQDDNPPTTQILEAWPKSFDVSIEVLDPSAVIEWHAFVDYDRITRPGFVGGGELDPDPASQDGGVRALSVSLGKPPDLSACHTIEILVANSFLENHAPDSIGGDQATWFYAPSGSLDGCPTFDAGPTLDAGIDAEAGIADGAVE